MGETPAVRTGKKRFLGKICQGSVFSRDNAHCRPSEVSGIEFQDTVELRVPSRNHPLIYSYFGGWERMQRKKKINPVLQLEMELKSQVGWNGSAMSGRRKN